MSKSPLTKQVVQARLQGVEAALAKLDSDFATNSYHENKLVREALTTAKAELESAYERLFEEDAAGAYKLCGVAYLRIHFAQQLLDADAIEHHLGESDYLELSERKVPWESKVKQYLGLLEADLLNFRSEIEKQNMK